MVRQAHTYMVSAVSGATLIAIAIVAFVLLVSAQVFESWPIPALGDGGREAHISDARATPGGAAASTGSGAAPASQPVDASGKPDGGQRPPRGGSPQAGGIPEVTPTGGPGQGGPGEGGSGGPASSPAQAAPSSSGSSSPAGGGSGGGSSASSTSAKLTETVSKTVDGVDQAALGGTLGESGVTEAAESVVGDVAGPESAVGHAVDETANTLGGLLGGRR